MKKITLTLSSLLVCIISFTACQDEKKEKTEVETLQEQFDKNMKEVIAIHDEVMPKMSEINKLLADLEIQSSKMEGEEYNRASTRLQQAHQEMMTWMKDFSNNFDSKEVNSGITTEDLEELKAKNELLESFKDSAERMRENVLTSLRYGQELYERYK